MNKLETCIICGELITDHSKQEGLTCYREFVRVATLDGNVTSTRNDNFE